MSTVPVPERFGVFRVCSETAVAAVPLSFPAPLRGAETPERFETPRNARFLACEISDRIGTRSERHVLPLEAA
jgi:hypothetical protein